LAAEMQQSTWVYSLLRSEVPETRREQVRIVGQVQEGKL